MRPTRICHETDIRIVDGYAITRTAFGVVWRHGITILFRTTSGEIVNTVAASLFDRLGNAVVRSRSGRRCSFITSIRDDFVGRGVVAGDIPRMGHCSVDLGHCPAEEARCGDACLVVTFHLIVVACRYTGISMCTAILGVISLAIIVQRCDTLNQVITLI